MEDYTNLDFEISEKAKKEWLEGKTKEELRRAYYWLLQNGKVTLPEYLEAIMEKGRPNC
jgi:hypothetical protein